MTLDPSTLDPLTYVELVDSLIDADRYADLLTDPDVGAINWFHGVTRRKTVIGDVTRITEHLSYTAHRSMAVTELEKLAAAVAEEFSLAAVVIVHRLGEVPIGQASILVGCSSAHRRDCFAATAAIMDRVKADVPIWKRETFVGGERAWVHP